MFAHYHLAVVGREDRQQADLELRAADGIPGNPDAVRSAKFRRAEMRSQLLRCKDEFAIGFAAVGTLRGIIKAIDRELPFDGNGLIFRVVKVESPTIPAGRGFARHVVHRWRPERDHARRRLIVGLLILGIRIP